MSKYKKQLLEFIGGCLKFLSTLFLICKAIPEKDKWSRSKKKLDATFSPLIRLVLFFFFFYKSSSLYQLLSRCGVQKNTCQPQADLVYRDA